MEHHLKQDDETKDGMDSEPGEVAAFLNPSVTRETFVIIGTEGVDTKCDDANQVEVKCDDMNQVEVDNLFDYSHYIKPWENSLCHGIDTASASVQLLKTKEFEHQIREITTYNADCLLSDTTKAAEDQQVFGKETHVDDQILKGIDLSTGSHSLEDLHCPSEVRSIEQHMAESCISNIVETSSLPPKVKSSPHIAEGCIEDLKSRSPEKANKCQPVDLSHFHRQFKENMHEDVVVEGDSNIEGNDIDIITIEDGIPSSSEPKIDQTTFGEDSIFEGKTHLQGNDNQLGSKAVVSSSDSSLVLGVDNNLFDGQGDGSSNHVEDLPSLTISCSSTELISLHHN